MDIIKDIVKLKEILTNYFDIGDSDFYTCTRDRSAFNIGTMSLDDFKELDEDFIEDLIEYIIKKWE